MRLARFFAWISVLSISATVASRARAEGNEQGIEFFEKHVRPVLVARCFDCHGPDSSAEGGLRVDSLAALLEGGNTGPAIQLGNPDESLLIDVVNHGKLYQMPPRLKLPAKEIADLSAWVKMGAPWPGASVTESAKRSSDESRFAENQRNHWSFQPISRPTPPEVSDAEWVRNDLDRFVLNKLEAKGLHPAPPADKRTWIRRATFDLTGLPPTPQEIQAFLEDDSADSFSKVIDRLLASPRYGERWGRHWLDIARYADSNGMDENLAYVNAFRYRDYVVAAFNNDLPYDQFVREQLAGDLLDASNDPEESARRRIATGFLSLGPKMLAEDDGRKMEMDIIDEQIETLGKALMGLTLGCARCHDHKYDPIPTADYYSLAGIFKSTKTMENFAVVATWHEVPVPSRQEEAARLAHEHSLGEVRAEITSVVEQANRQLLEAQRRQTASYIRAAAELLRQRANPILLKSAMMPPVEATPPGLMTVEAEDFDRGNVLKDEANYGVGIGVILNKGELPNFVEYDVILPESGPYQLEIRYAAAESRPAMLSIHGTRMNSNVLGEVTGSWTPESQEWTVVGVFAMREGENTIRLERNGPFPHIDKLVLFPWIPPEGVEVALPRSEEQIAAEHQVHAPFVSQWASYLEATHADVDALLAAWARVEEAGYTNDSHSGAAEETLRRTVFDPKGPFAVPENVERLYPTEIAESLGKLKEKEDRIVKSAPVIPNAMAVSEGSPQNARIHLRGSHQTLGAEVPRRFPRILAGEDRIAISGDGSGRRELADWLAQPDHPLTSRVMVNRIWRWHFGTGLVRTPDNFGLLGDTPVHGELLDWLARRFVESGWSVKEIHRLIINSSTYRMSAAFDENAFQVDPENRLLWRKDRRRLEAEAIRDAILAVSGSLDLTVGGTLLKNKPREYVAGTASVDGTNYQSTRRSVYLPVIRSSLYDVFQAFDFADPSTLNGDRPTTTVAPQALFMMNGNLVRAQSMILARKLLDKSPTDPQRRVQAAYEWILGRPATEEEITRAGRFLEHCRRELRAENADEDEREARAWQSLCRVLIASNEFLYCD